MAIAVHIPRFSCKTIFFGGNMFVITAASCCFIKFWGVIVCFEYFLLFIKGILIL